MSVLWEAIYPQAGEDALWYVHTLTDHVVNYKLRKERNKYSFKSPIDIAEGVPLTQDGVNGRTYM